MRNVMSIAMFIAVLTSGRLVTFSGDAFDEAGAVPGPSAQSPSAAAADPQSFGRPVCTTPPPMADCVCVGPDRWVCPEPGPGSR